MTRAASQPASEVLSRLLSTGRLPQVAVSGALACSRVLRRRGPEPARPPPLRCRPASNRQPRLLHSLSLLCLTPGLSRRNDPRRFTTRLGKSSTPPELKSPNHPPPSCDASGRRLHRRASQLPRPCGRSPRSATPRAHPRLSYSTELHSHRLRPPVAPACCIHRRASLTRPYPGVSRASPANAVQLPWLFDPPLRPARSLPRCPPACPRASFSVRIASPASPRGFRPTSRAAPSACTGCDPRGRTSARRLA